jgi:superfamily II DNA/RNA helicase
MHLRGAKCLLRGCQLLGYAIFLQSVDRFKNDEQAVLVATDVAARGLDIKGVR